MAFKILSNNRYGSKFITIDRNYRIALSAAVRKELGIYGKVGKIFIMADKENKRLGIVRQESARVPNANPFAVDRRGYVNARQIIHETGWYNKDKPIRFEEDGWENFEGNKWYIFRMV